MVHYEKVKVAYSTLRYVKIILFPNYNKIWYRKIFKVLFDKITQGKFLVNIM